MQDLDHNGIPEVVLQMHRTATNESQVGFGALNSRFDVQHVYASAGGAHAIASPGATQLDEYANSGDIDGDGVPDLFGMRANSSSLSIFLLSRSGHVKEELVHNSSGLTGCYRPINAGDLDGNGVNDAVIACKQSKAFWVQLMNADGGSVSCANISLTDLGLESTAASRFGEYGFGMGDLDKDGRSWLAMPESVPGKRDQQRIYLVQLDDSGEPVQSSLRTIDRPENYTGEIFGSNAQNAGDLDGDGVNDIYDDGMVLLLTANGTVKQLVQTGGRGARPGPVPPLDMDGNGVPDLFTDTGIHLMGHGGAGPRTVRGITYSNSDLAGDDFPWVAESQAYVTNGTTHDIASASVVRPNRTIALE